MTIGLPRSGKTTWARQQGVPMVNPDSIRVAVHGQRYNRAAEPFVWLIARTMVQALFLAGHPTVILDATNTTKQRREEWRNDAEWTRGFKYMPTAVEECLQRAALDGDDYIMPIIERQAAQFEAVTQDEDPFVIIGDLWRAMGTD